MSSTSRLNFVLGFSIILFGACYGAFVAKGITDSIIAQAPDLESWSMILVRSAHGHLSLFGIIHVLFGLTLPYSAWGRRIQVVQTGGIFCGALAMGVGLSLRAYEIPNENLSISAYVIGLLLSMTILSLFTHILGLLVAHKRG